MSFNGSPTTALQQKDLSHAVDVYHDWIDACEAVNAAGKASKAAAQDRNRDRDRDRDRDGERPRRSKPYDRYDDE